jgi:hypothetical protein
MNTLEDRLRDAFRADADTVRPGTIPPAPAPPAAREVGDHRKRRARVLIPLAAAAAVIALVAGLSLATPAFGPQVRPFPALRPASPPAAGSWPSGPVHTPVFGAQASRGVPATAPAPGVPRFFVTVYKLASGAMDYIVVRDTTSRRVATITPPAGHFFGGLAATAGDRTFLTTVQPDRGCTSQLEWFRLDDQGRPGPLVPLHITVPRTDNWIGDLAITPDGRTIAYAAYECDGAGDVGVIHLATRQARVWPEPMPRGAPFDLSLSPDGRWLGYTMLSDGARILPTDARAGQLSARSRSLSAGAQWAALADDGKTLLECTVSPHYPEPPSQFGTLSYGTRPVAGGRQHVIASWRDVDVPQCYASLDPAGNYLLVQYPTVVRGANGWLRPAILNVRTGQLTAVPAPAFDRPVDVAW